MRCHYRTAPDEAPPLAGSLDKTLEAARVADGSANPQENMAENLRDKSAYDDGSLSRMGHLFLGSAITFASNPTI